MATWVDYPAAFREVVLQAVTGKITSYFKYRGNVTDGFICHLFVNGADKGEYDTKAHARTAGDGFGA